MTKTPWYRFGLLWSFLTGASFALASTLVGSFLNRVDYSTVDYLYLLLEPLAVATLGLFVGAGQWIALRLMRSKKSISWISVTTIGLPLGIYFGIGMSRMLSDTINVFKWIDTFVIFVIAGMFVGMLQWISLHKEFVGFYGWIVVSGLGWGIGMFFVRDIFLFMDTGFGNFYAPIFGFLGGTILGALSGGFVEHTLLLSLRENE